MTLGRMMYDSKEEETLEQSIENQMEKEKDEIQQNISCIKTEIDEALVKSGRCGHEVKILGVTKTVDPMRISLAVSAGITHLGENKVQEALSKIPLVKGRVVWHFIGYLQRNKVRKTVPFFDIIQSVDRKELSEEINRCAENFGKIQKILIEVNTSGESTKSGVKPEELIDLLDYSEKLPHIQVKGLMTIGSFSPDAEIVRHDFRTLVELKNAAEKRGYVRNRMEFLSMGMSSDYKIAVEEGSNIVRIGTAIFGRRS